MKTIYLKEKIDAKESKTVRRVNITVLTASETEKIFCKKGTFLWLVRLVKLTFT